MVPMIALLSAVTLSNMSIVLLVRAWFTLIRCCCFDIAVVDDISCWLCFGGCLFITESELAAFRYCTRLCCC